MLHDCAVETTLLTCPQTMTVVLHFLLAMVQNPSVLTKAQKEIDSVVGNDRLPTFDDRVNLPYVNCVFDECLRWGVPVPLSTPCVICWRGVIISDGPPQVYLIA